MNLEVLQLGFQIRIVVLVVIFQSMTPNMDTLCLLGMGCFRVLSGLLVFDESSEDCIRVPPAQKAAYSSSESTVFPVLPKHVCFAENSLLGSWLTGPEERIQCTVSGYCLCQRREFSTQSLVTVHQNFSQCPEAFSFPNSQATLS